MTYGSLFGPVVTRYQLENAVISTIQTWIQYYLAEVERALGLVAHTIPVPPDAKSFHGGLDFDIWMQELEPCIIVNAQPTGPAERYEAGKYNQMYQIDVAAICVADQQFVDSASDAVDFSEDPARHLADLYGGALQMLLTQQGGFGSGTVADEEGAAIEELAIETHLWSAPKTEWVNPDVRRVARSVTSIRSLVGPIVDQFQGLRTPPGNPYANPGNWVQASNVGITVETEDALGNLDALNGTQVVVNYNGGTVKVNE